MPTVLNLKDFKQAVKRTHTGLTYDPTLPILTNIRLTSISQGLVVSATDRYALSMLHVHATGDDGDMDVLVDRRDLFKALAMFSPDRNDEVSLTVDETHLEVTDLSSSVSVRLPLVPFVGWPKLANLINTDAAVADFKFPPAFEKAVVAGLVNRLDDVSLPKEGAHQGSPWRNLRITSSGAHIQMAPSTLKAETVQVEAWVLEFKERITAAE